MQKPLKVQVRVIQIKFVMVVFVQEVFNEYSRTLITPIRIT